VVSFFKQYLNSGETTGQTHGQTRRQTRAGAPSGGQIYTNAMIADLYSRHRKGELTGEKWDAIERDIFEAQRSNRLNVRPFLTK
jgi:hypothetical protein